MFIKIVGSERAADYNLSCFISAKCSHISVFLTVLCIIYKLMRTLSYNQKHNYWLEPKQTVCQRLNWTHVLERTRTYLYSCKLTYESYPETLNYPHILVSNFLLMPLIAILGSILDSQLNWESGKFQLARWSQEVGLFPERTNHPPTHPHIHPTIWIFLVE